MNPGQLARQVAEVNLADQLRQEAPATEVAFIKLPEAQLRNKAGAYRNPCAGQQRFLLTSPADWDKCL